jgi:hypothetical protein
MIKIAKGLIKLYMQMFGFKGLTTPWKQIYIMEGYENSQWLIRHELKHIEQMQRDGWFTFHIMYFYYLLKYGYYENPYEIEARNAENKLYT